MKYFVEYTPTGFRIGWEGKTLRTYIDCDGSHTPAAEVYAKAERAWNSLRGEANVFAREEPLHAPQA